MHPCKLFFKERLKQGLTQQDVADKTLGKVSNMDISRIEFGCRAEAQKVVAIAFALSISPNRLTNYLLA